MIFAAVYLTWAGLSGCCAHREAELMLQLFHQVFYHGGFA
jgi:hypothetical protein